MAEKWRLVKKSNNKSIQVYRRNKKEYNKLISIVLEKRMEMGKNIYTKF
jgi:hypothetical protein